MFLILGSDAFEIVNQRVTFTTASKRCQLAQPMFRFDNTSFKLTPEESLNMQRNTGYWLGYVYTQTAYLYLGESYQDQRKSYPFYKIVNTKKTALNSNLTELLKNPRYIF